MPTREPEPPSLVEAIASVTTGATRTQSLERLLAAACAMGGVEHAALAVLDRNGGIGEVLHSGLSPEQLAAIGRLPLGHGLLSEISRSSEPLVYDDVEGHLLHPGSEQGTHPDASVLLGVPIRSQGRPLGMLLLGDEKPREDFGPELAGSLEALAGLASYI